MTKLQTAEQSALGVYKRLTALAPKDPQAWIDLGTNAQNLGDSATAISAYKKAIALEPDSSDVTVLQQRIKQLQTGSSATSG